MQTKSSSLVTLTLLFSFLFLQQTYCQTNYQPGSVITKSGDTLKGLIDYRNWENNPNEISFRLSATSQPIKYSPDIISGFVVNNEEYISATVKAEISPTQIDQLDYRPAIITRTDTTFLQVMFRGSKNLFFYSDRIGKQHFYIGQYPDFELLIYKKYLKEGSRENVVAENKTFLGQLNLYLQDCPEIKSNINNTAYNKKSLEKLFNEYYQSTEKKIDYKYVKEKIRLDFGAIAGVSVTKLKLSCIDDSFGYLTNGDYEPSWKPSAGLFMDVVLARNQRKWSIYNELFYSAYVAKGHTEDYFSENNYKIYNNSIGYSYLKLNNMLRFTYLVKKDLFIFINAGISNGYAISETNLSIKEVKFYTDPVITEEPAMHETRKYELGFLGGLGARYSDFSFETRFESGNGMSVYTILKSKANRIYFLLGYRF